MMARPQRPETPPEYDYNLECPVCGDIGGYCEHGDDWIAEHPDEYAEATERMIERQEAEFQRECDALDERFGGG